MNTQIATTSYLFDPALIPLVPKNAQFSPVVRKRVAVKEPLPTLFVEAAPVVEVAEASVETNSEAAPPADFTETWEHLYKTYYEKLVRYCLFKQGDQGCRSDAEDIVMDVIHRVALEIGSVAPNAVPNYLKTCVLNKIRDRARRTTRVQMHSLDKMMESSDDKQGFEPADDAPALSDHAERLLKIEAVRNAIATLSKDHQQIVLMYYFQELEVNVIARVLDIPSGTVKSRLARARDVMFRKLTYMMRVES